MNVNFNTKFYLTMAFFFILSNYYFKARVKCKVYMMDKKHTLKSN